MSEGVVIHNGEVQGQVPEVKSDPLPVDLPRAAPVDADLDPEHIAQLLAAEINRWQEAPFATEPYQSAVPMELVNRLLQLKDEKENKLLFTRFDLFQCFAIWTRKLKGEERIPGADR